MDNTLGYIQAALDALHTELARSLSGAAWEDTLIADDTTTLIQRHNDAVARRRPRA
jgi:hypothetical protein